MKNIHFIIALLAGICFGCGPSKEEIEAREKQKLDSTLVSEQNKVKNLIETAAEEESQHVSRPTRSWRAVETNLPIGTVEAMDCFHFNRRDQNPKDNYITIKRMDGTSTIVKDIDEDLFLNIEVGDKIE